jgi:hypothetical protein
MGVGWMDSAIHGTGQGAWVGGRGAAPTLRLAAWAMLGCLNAAGWESRMCWLWKEERMGFRLPMHLQCRL